MIVNPSPWQLLEGVRVLDLGQHVPTPYASLMLSDFGADVVKVEAPHGDALRAWGAERPNEPSAFFCAMNAHKRGVRLDLKSDKDRATLFSLIERADVMLESFRPGVSERLGLTREAIERANPTLIRCVISGFGTPGPYAALGGHDLNCLAASGMLSLSGSPDAPTIPAPPISDFAAALQAASIIVAGLLRRERSGQGLYIDLSMTEVLLGWQAESLARARAGRPELPRGSGAADGGRASYAIYRAADDRFIALGAEEPRAWATFCRTVGRAEWIERFDDPQPQHALRANVANLISSRASAQWEALLCSADCGFSLVASGSDVLNDTHFAARRVLQIDGQTVHALNPAWLDGQPAPQRSAFGEVDVQQILREWSVRAVEIT
jgi:alpha-methylacyl-CoA racemase